LGEIGARNFGLTPLLFHRGDAVMTMLYFALCIGFFHVCLGLGLGGWAAIKLGKTKEACFKISTIALLVCLALYLATYIWLPLIHYKDFILFALLISVLSLLFSGGLLGPLETFKALANIISYARLMAVGLTSVLLAHLANHMAWHSKSFVIGLIAAILLHGFNLLLGLFAPTVHTLRLHFVEFFSHFIESGGRKFQPLAKEERSKQLFELEN
jgi:V/A-type H+-transporting ATPase subunit I